MCEVDCYGSGFRPVTATSDSSGVAGEGSIGNEPRSVDISGEIFVVDPNSFAIDTGRPFADGATVEMILASDGSLVAQSTSRSRFSINGVMGDTLSYVGVFPDSGLDALPTLQWIDTLASGDVGVGVVRASTLDLIYGVVSLPENRNPDAAQVVLRFLVESTGLGLSGVEVFPPFGAKAIYDQGGGWTDGMVGSGSRGLAILRNFAAVGLGPKEVTIPFSLDGTTRESVTVTVGAGLVTCFDVRVSR